MNQKNQKEYLLEGLCCPNCAMKIESAINNLKEIETAQVNFATKVLYIQYNTDSLETLLSQIGKIINRIEPEVVMIDRSTQEEPRLQASHAAKRDDSKIGKRFLPISKELYQPILQFSLGGILYLIAILAPLPSPIPILLFLISYGIVGGEVLLRAIKNILHGEVFDENFLMAIATIGAFLIGEYPEAVAVMLFYQIGELFQDMAVDKSRRSIADLMDIRPDYANLLINHVITTVSPETAKVGDLFVVKPGERVPLDGIVVEGSSMLNTSSLTGESVPKTVTKGDTVLGGSINKNGLLTVEVLKEFHNSTISKILALVENASNRKAPTEKFITKFAKVYTPIVTISALFLALIPPMIIPGATFSEWIYRALIFLVVSCPCALVVSIPLGFFGGIGAASKNGILVKGSNYLEALNSVDTIIFDKTGTLTKGVFQVTELHPEDGISRDDLLHFAAYSEHYSNHPIATSIGNYYNSYIEESKIKDFNEIMGYGIQAIIDEESIQIGNAKLMEQQNIIYKKTDSFGTIVHIARNHQYIGYLVISDEIKTDAKQSIAALRKLGVSTLAMLTGDNQKVGETIGKELSLDKVYTNLLPDEKVKQLEKLEKEKKTSGKIVFVGDGINDAPVLARADIGVAMGGLGSDAAIEASDVVLMTDEPSKLVVAIEIAKRTRIIVLQNIIFALGIKLLVLLLGALGMANMWAAVFADVGVALLAVLNSMRIMKYK